MNILCLVDFRPGQGDHWLWNYLPNAKDQVDFVVPPPALDWVHGPAKALVYYPAFVWLGVQSWRWIAHHLCDVVLAWEGKNGLALACLRALLRRRWPKLVIAGYSHRGLATVFPWLIRFAMRYVDRVIVFTHWEAERLPPILGMEPARVVFCPLGSYDVQKVKPSIRLPFEYIYSGGRSYRDYRTLVQAMKEIACPLILNAAPGDMRRIPGRSNVLRYGMVSLETYWNLMNGSLFVVIPMRAVCFSAGLIAILNAMAAGKAIIATRIPASEDYIEDGETGLLVTAGSVSELHDAIAFLLENPDERARLGRNARRQFELFYTIEAFSERIHHLLEDVCRSA
jgi:glycosyltransferase involved in cell wall biosynthesis